MNKEKMSAQGGSALGGKTKKLAYWASVTTLGIVLGVSLQFVRAWTEPTAPAPGGNVGAPINTSAIAQTKAGSLTVQGGISVPQICLGNTPCITMWPTGGTGGNTLPPEGAMAVDELEADGYSFCSGEGTGVCSDIHSFAYARVKDGKIQTRAAYVNYWTGYRMNNCDTGWVDSETASCTAEDKDGPTFYAAWGKVQVTATRTGAGVKNKTVGESYFSSIEYINIYSAPVAVYTPHIPIGNSTSWDK